MPNEAVTIAVSDAEYRLILKAFGLLPRSMEGFPKEHDVLLFGRCRCGHPRPPIVAAYYAEHTDDPGWYTHDDPDNLIDMVPETWLPLDAIRAIDLTKPVEG